MVKSAQTKRADLSSRLQAASARLRGDIDAARAAGMDYGDFCSKRSMEEIGLAWTRENYIRWAWAGLDLPEEWDEDELPKGLQDWSAPAPTV